MEETPIETLIIDGLLIDGAHHKQYFLQKLFKELVPEARREALLKKLEKQDYHIEPGVPP